MLKSCKRKKKSIFKIGKPPIQYPISSHNLKHIFFCLRVVSHHPDQILNVHFSGSFYFIFSLSVTAERNASRHNLQPVRAVKNAGNELAYICTAWREDEILERRLHWICLYRCYGRKLQPMLLLLQRQMWNSAGWLMRCRLGITSLRLHSFSPKVTSLGYW